VAATGNRALLVDSPAALAALARLPVAVHRRVDWAAARPGAAQTAETVLDIAEPFDMVLLAGDAPDAHALRRGLAGRSGARVPVLRVQDGRYALDRMVTEQVVTVNTAAAGGNASLMSLKPL
jgi:RHH-type proline utilization regulon transcriptional repressor/proline dehydrogenase/delta 1-pyrroline-5-carboxylate dehydrogenase